MQKLGAVGFSLGSSAIIHAFSNFRVPDLKAVVLEGVFASSFHVGEKELLNRYGKILGRFIGYAFFTVGAQLCSLGRFRHSQPVKHVDKISPTPLMIIRGDNDPLVYAESAQAVIEAAKKPLEIWKTPAGGHTRAYKVYPEEYIKRVLGFLDSHV